MSGQDYLTTSTEVIRSIISSEVEKLRLELLKSLTDTFSNQLKLIRDDVTKLQEAVNFVNSQHEDILAKLDKINAEVRPVLNLPSTMNDAIKSIKARLQTTKKILRQPTHVESAPPKKSHRRGVPVVNYNVASTTILKFAENTGVDRK
ncbi:hypothetical protein ACJJTC_002365 [Scirpophaga incertulas]